MKLLIFFAIIAAINAVPIPDYDDGQYHEDPNEDNGQYHEDHSGDYHSENSGRYHESNFNNDDGGSKVEPYKHIRYEDHSGDYHPENSGSYHESQLNNENGGSKVKPYKPSGKYLDESYSYFGASASPQHAGVSAYSGQNGANYNNFNKEKNLNQYLSQTGTSNNGQYIKSSGDDGQYHSDQNEQTGKYTGFTNSHAASVNGQKTEYSLNKSPTGSSHPAVKTQNLFGQKVLSPSLHKVVNQEDDGQYYPEQISQGAGRSTYSSSGSTGHNVATGNVAHKLPVPQHSGSSNSAVSNQNVFGQNVVGTSSHKGVNQEDNGQYHPEQVSQGAGRSTYSSSGSTGHNVAPGNVGHKLPVTTQSGSSNSAVGNQNVFGQHVVSTSSHKTVNQENDGQYHPEQVSQGTGRSTYSSSGSTSHNVAPGNVGHKFPVVQHTGSYNSAVSNQNVFGPNVVGTSSHKAVNQEDDGQYHAEEISQGAGRSTYSSSASTGHNVAPGNVGHKLPVSQHGGTSTSAVSNQNIFGHNVVGTSSHKTGNQEDDGQYHPEQVSQGAGRSTYSSSASTGHNVAPGNVGHKLPVAQYSGPSTSAVSNQNAFRPNVVGTSSHKAVNQEDDGQYHAEQVSQGSGRYTYSSSGSKGHNVAPGNVGHKLPVAQHSGSPNSPVGNQNVFGQHVVSTSSHKTVNQEDDGQYHPEQFSQGAGRSTYSSSGSTGHNVAPGNVGHKLPVAQHSGPSNSPVGNQNIFGQHVVSTSSHKTGNQEEDGQYHPEQVSQGTGRSTYSSSGSTGHNVAPGNVGHKLPVTTQSGSSNSAVGNQNVFGQNVVSTSSHKAVNQEDDGQYHSEQVSQGAGRSTYSSSGSTGGHNVAPGNFGHKLPGAQHSGPSNSAIGNQNVFGQNVVGTSSHKTGNQEDDGQYHSEQVSQGAGRSTYSSSGSTGHNVAPGNVGHKLPVTTQSGSSNSAVGNQNVFGQHVVSTSSHKTVNQEDDGQYHPEQVSQGAGRSTYSSSGSTGGHNVAPGNFGHKLPVAQHGGPSNFAVGNQNVFGQNVVGTSSHKTGNQEDDGQYHPEQVSQGTGRSTYSSSGSTGHNVAPGNVGHKLPVTTQSGSSNSAVGNQNLFGQNVVSTSSHKAVNQEDDGKYHPEQVSQGAGRSTYSSSGSTGHNVAPGNVGHKLPVTTQSGSSNSAVGNQNVFGQNVVSTSSHKAVNQEDDGQYHSEQVSQGAGRSTYSSSGSTGGHNVAPGNFGHKLPGAQHSGPSNSAIGNQNVFGQNVVGTSSHKTGNQEDDGQYHSEQVSQGAGRSTYSSSGSTGHNVAPGNVGHKLPVTTQSGSSNSAVGNQNVFGQHVVSTSSHKTVNQEDDGQYHPEQVSQGAGRSTYSSSGSTGGHNVAPGNFGHKLPVAQHGGPSNFAVGNQNVFGQNVVGTSSHKTGNQEDDGQYHPEQVSQGTGRSTYSSSGSTGHNVAPGNVGHKLPAAQHSGPSNSPVGNQNVFGQNVVSTSSHKAVNQEDDGKYHPEQVSQGAGRSTYSSSGSTGHNVAPGNVEHKLPVAQHSGPSNSPVGNQNIFGQHVVSTSSHKTGNQEDDGQYHPEQVSQGTGRSTYSSSGSTGHNVAPGNVGHKLPVTTQSGSSNSAVGNQNLFGQNVVSTSSHKAVNQEDDGKYHPEQVSQGAGRSTYSSSGSTGHNVAPGNVGHKLPVAQHSGPSNSPVGNQNIFGQHVVSTSSYKTGNQEEDGQYHPEQVSQGTGRSTYSSSGSTGHNVAPGNVGHKLPVTTQSGSSNSAVGNQNLFGQNVVSTSSHKAVNQEDDGKYHPEQVSQGAGRSTYSSSGSTGHNVAPGNVGHKLPVAQHSGPSNSPVGNQNIFGQHVVSTSSHKTGNQEEDGQYHPEQVSQGTGRSTYSSSGSTGHNVAPGNVGHKLPVTTQSGSSNSAVGNQNLFGQNVVSTSSHKALNQEDDGQYHSEQVSQGAGRSTYSSSGSTGGHNVAPGNFGHKLPGAQHSGPSNSAIGNQNVFGQNVVGTSSHKTGNQEDDGQYHPEQVSQGAGRSTYSSSGSTGHNVAPGNVGHKLPVAQHSGSPNSPVGNQNVFGQHVVSPSSQKTVNKEDDGQYHSEQVGQGAGRSTYSSSGSTEYNVAPVNVGQKTEEYSSYKSFFAKHSGSSNPGVSNQNGLGKQGVSTSNQEDGQYHSEQNKQVSQNGGRSYSFSGNTVNNVATGNVGHKTEEHFSYKSPDTQHSGLSNYEGSNQNGFGQKLVSFSSYKSVNDGQYHPDSSKVGQIAGKSNFLFNSLSSGAPSQNEAHGKTLFTSSNLASRFSDSSNADSQNVAGVSNNNLFSTSGYKQDRTVVSEYAKPSGGAHFQHSNQEVFEIAQPRVHVEPLGQNEMKQVHKTVQSSVFKHGQENGNTNAGHIGTIKKTEEFTDDGYHYIYETENGIFAEEEGHLVEKGTKNVHLKVKGFYSYTGPVVYTVEYTANSINGFVPKFSNVEKSERLSKSAKFQLQK